jgi:hypothetical protein
LSAQPADQEVLGSADIDMTGFQAIVLICLATSPREACDETNAIVSRSVHVENELGCTSGWQEIIARGGLQESLKGGNYLKTLCKRDKVDQ